MFYFGPTKKMHYSDYAYYSPSLGGFSPEECQSILNLWDDRKKSKATTGQDASSLLTHTQNEIRNSFVQWLDYSDDLHWLFEKLTRIVLDCNSVRYNFQLTGFLEPLQLTEYQVGQKYDWHTDNGNEDFSIRKLSIVVPLTDHRNYNGGELQILGTKLSNAEQGSVIVFPSYNAHKVHEVTSGTRHSLVAWVSGEPFK